MTLLILNKQVPAMLMNLAKGLKFKITNLKVLCNLYAGCTFNSFSYIHHDFQTMKLT